MAVHGCCSPPRLIPLIKLQHSSVSAANTLLLSLPFSFLLVSLLSSVAQCLHQALLLPSHFLLPSSFSLHMLEQNYLLQCNLAHVQNCHSVNINGGHLLLRVMNVCIAHTPEAIYPMISVSLCRTIKCLPTSSA